MKIRLVQLEFRDEIVGLFPGEFGRAEGRTADPSTTLPRFPVGLDGVVAINAPFFTEGRIGGLV